MTEKQKDKQNSSFEVKKRTRIGSKLASNLQPEPALAMNEETDAEIPVTQEPVEAPIALPGEPTLNSLDAFFASLEYQNEAFVYTSNVPLTAFTGHILYRFSDVLRLGSLRDELAMAFNTLLDPATLAEKLSTAKNFDKLDFKKISAKVGALYMS